MKNLITTAFAVCFLATALVAQNCPSQAATKVSTALSKKDIVDTAVAAGSFNTLVTAVKTADLVSALKGKGPFTILAPTDAAFAKLPEGTIASLLKPENREKLQTILKYHVISGRAYSPTVVKADKVSPLAGGDVTISVRNGKAYANDACIIKTDIDASNGVIHVIDTVLLPK